jgi:hypothetical protein
MLRNILIAPSLNSLFITGFLLLYVFYLLVTHFKEFVNLDFFRKINILSLFVIAIGIHGLIHLGVEANYGFNPYKWV